MHNPILLTHNSAGGQTVGAGKRTFILPTGTWRLRDVEARLTTAPTGAAFLIDINKNGTTIFPTQGDRTSIAISANASSAHKPQGGASFGGGDRLSYDVDVVGSTVAGSDLDISFLLEQA